MATFTRVLKNVIDKDPTILTDTLAHYPIYDVAHRAVLNGKIVDHYFNQEIGMETVSMFKLALKRRMNEIMPYYNQQYLASQIAFDPLKTISIKNLVTAAGSINSTGNSTNTSESDALSRAVASELPQVRLSPDKDYATAAQDNNSRTTANGTAAETRADTTAGNTDSETTGYQGAPAQIIWEYRQALVNVDMMVIEQLHDLFMLIWSNGDEFTNGTGFNNGYFYPYALSL